MNFERRIAPLLKEREKNRAFFGKLIRAEKQKKDRDAVQSLISEFHSEDEVIEMRIDALITHTLVSDAESLFLPVPERSDKKLWKESYTSGQYCLSPEGISLLRDAIRDEKKKRREVRFAYIEVIGKVVAMLTGLVGACIGLASILRR